MRILIVIGLTGFFMAVMSCGDTPSDGCDDAEDYVACVGTEAFLSEQSRIGARADERNYAHVDPASHEAINCDDNARHFCNGDEGSCLWLVTHEENGRPYMACDCSFPLEQHHFDRVCEGD